MVLDADDDKSRFLPLLVFSHNGRQIRQKIARLFSADRTATRSMALRASTRIAFVSKYYCLGSEGGFAFLFAS